MMELDFEAEMIEWRGPAPFFFLPIPGPQSDEIRRVAKSVSYGWGVIPVVATIAGVSFYTALFPRDDLYLLPVKDKVRRQIGVTAGDTIAVSMKVGQREV